jgi:hypothetical protein
MNNSRILSSSNKFNIIPYSHEELLTMLESLKNGILLKPEEYEGLIDLLENNVIDKINESKEAIRSSILSNIESRVDREIIAIKEKINQEIEDNLSVYRQEVNEKLNTQYNLIDELKENEAKFEITVDDKISKAESNLLAATNARVDEVIDSKLLGFKNDYQTDFTGLVNQINGTISDIETNAEEKARLAAETLINEKAVNFASKSEMNLANNNITDLSTRVNITESVIQQNINKLTELNNTIVTNNNILNDRIDNLDILSIEDIKDMFVSQDELIRLNNDIIAIGNKCDGLDAILSNMEGSNSNIFRGFDERINAIDLKIDTEILKVDTELKTLINEIDGDIEGVVSNLEQTINDKIIEVDKKLLEFGNLPKLHIEDIEELSDELAGIRSSISFIEQEIKSLKKSIQQAP